MRTLVAASLVLALLPIAAAAPVVTSASWGVAGAPIEAAPGDTARLLTVTVQNVDDETYTSVRATLSGAGGITPAAGGDKAALAGLFASGDLWTMTFLVNVADNASATARLPLRLTMQYASSLNSVSRNLEVPVTLTGRPVLTLAAADDALPSWSRVDVPIDVRNLGSGAAGGVTLRASPAAGSSLTIADDGVRSIGGLAPNASRTANLSVVTGAPGSAALALSLSYTNAAGAVVAETRSLSLRVVDEAPAPLSARLVESDLEPGAPGIATFRVENAGSAAARDVSIRLALPPTASVLDGSDDQFLGDVAAGQAREARFAIRPSGAAADLLDVTLTLTWTDAAGVVHTSARKDALPLAQASAGPLRMGLASSTLAAGRAGALVFDLENEGASGVRDVRVAFTLPAGAATAFTPVNATDSQRLGELPAGAATRVTLSLLTSQSASDIYPIAASVSWVGDDGIVRSETFRFGALVRGTVQLLVTDGTALREDDGTISIAGTLTNLGNEEAHNAYLRILGEGGFEETEPQFLGDLDPNAALPFSVDASAAGDPRVAPLHLTWNDEYGQIHEARFDAPLRSIEPASDDDEPPEPRGAPGAGLLALVAIVALAALVARRKR